MIRLPFLRVFFFAAVISAVSFADICIAAAPSPPGQAATGPGGADYRHKAVRKSLFGSGPQGYWIYEPDQPAPRSAPVVVFNHGWSATNPRIYGAWIEHIVRRGNIVIYPIYQEPGTFRFPPEQITPNAIQAVKDAIKVLQGGGHVKPELDKFAIVGHSAGGQITANMAALAKSSGLPQPGAVMPVQPGKSWSKTERVQIPLADMSQVPAQTLLLAVVGDKDRIARDVDAKRVFYETKKVPLANKDFVIVVSDDHGEPALKASHFSPAAASVAYDAGDSEQKNTKIGLRQKLRDRVKARRARRHGTDELDFDRVTNSSQSVNTLDHYGTWKLFDGLCDAAFYGKNREYALGNTSQQRFMGKWSDGVPVKKLVVSDRP